MLRLEAEAVTVELDGRGAPDPSLVGETPRSDRYTTDHSGWYRQETGRSRLFTDNLHGYSSLGASQLARDLGNVGQEQERSPRQGQGRACDRAIMSKRQWVWARQRG